MEMTAHLQRTPGRSSTCAIEETQAKLNALQKQTVQHCADDAVHV
jgi:hypothetical protein